MYQERSFLAQPRRLPEEDAILSRNVQSKNVLRLTLLLLAIVTSRLICYAEGQSLNGAQVIQEANQVSLLSNEPRPLKAVIVSLTEEFGWTVDYEDPPYSKSSPDLFDLTDPNWKAAHPNDLFFGLKGGPFHVHLLGGETASALASPSVVQRIVTEYNESRLPGHFAVRTGFGGRMAAVGVATRNSSGEYQPSRVILDNLLELSSATVSLQDALTDLTAALSRIPGPQVAVGTVPSNLLNQIQCVMPVGRMSARAALDRILDSAPLKIAYYLLYDPNDDLYVLNLSVVTRVEKNAHGASEKSVVRQ